MSSIVEAILILFCDSLPNLARAVGNKAVKALFPNGFIEEDTLLSGVIGALIIMGVIATGFYLLITYS